MKRLCLLASLILVSLSSISQENQLPPQYKPIKEVFGDLDKDGIKERVVVYNMHDREDDPEGIPREIVILKKKGDQWTTWHRSANAIGGTKDGGMMGDPFEDVEIVKGILMISESGGSSWKWNHTDKYRFQNNAFELIGYQSHDGRPCDYWESFDYNLSTGKIEFKKDYEKCNDDGEDLEVYKKEAESFVYKTKIKIRLENRKKEDIKIVTPKYKHALYL